MVYAACFNDEIRLWWDKRNDKKEGMKYRVFVDGKRCVYTENIYYNFKNLKSGTAYDFEVQLVDERKQVVGVSQSKTASTLQSREVVEIGLNGDGLTDHTKAIQTLLDENPSGKRLHIPVGVYLTEELTFSGNIEVEMDAGAILCDKEMPL